MASKRREQKRRVNDFGFEVVIYGGLPMRRIDVYTLACEHLGEHAKPPFGADYFAYASKAVEGLEPWPLNEAREVMK